MNDLSAGTGHPPFVTVAREYYVGSPPVERSPRSAAECSAAAPKSIQTVLVVDDNPLLGYALSAGLERAGRRIIVCRDIQSAELIVENEPVTDIVTDVRLTNAFRFEGLDFLGHVNRHAPEARVVLITGHVAEGLESEAERLGAVKVLAKPFEIEALEGFLTPQCSDEPAEVVYVPTLDEIIQSKELCSVFQPIVSLDGRVTGFESLARLRTPSAFRRPELLFTYAERKGGVGRLEAACVQRSLSEARELPDTPLLFLNIHPAALCESGFAAMIETLAGRFSLDLHRLVIEITEQQPLSGEEAVFTALDRLRRRGVQFALDDVGVAYSHLPFIARIRPSFLKISHQFGTRFHTDPIKRTIVRNLLTLGRDFDCQVILEGVEDTSTADAARDLGIPLNQGYLFGYPAEARSYRTDPSVP
jgi:EAL domain-containing protein (putative c-di-GMP-specific phosphodiesterase class I)/ActR/RegA family two-component response regulator